MKNKKAILTQEQKDFAKVKRFVAKHFPGSRTFAKSTPDGKNKYTVVDQNGFAVVNGELMIPPASSVRKAWVDAKYSIWFTNMIRKSNAAFNEEKIFKKLAKESGE